MRNCPHYCKESHAFCGLQHNSTWIIWAAACTFNFKSHFCPRVPLSWQICSSYGPQLATVVVSSLRSVHSRNTCGKHSRCHAFLYIIHEFFSFRSIQCSERHSYVGCSSKKYCKNIQYSLVISVQVLPSIIPKQGANSVDARPVCKT